MAGKVSHSYAFRGSEKPLIGKTIGEMFDEIAEKYPETSVMVQDRDPYLVKLDEERKNFVPMPDHIRAKLKGIGRGN